MTAGLDLSGAPPAPADLLRLRLLRLAQQAPTALFDSLPVPEAIRARIIDTPVLWDRLVRGLALDRGLDAPEALPALALLDAWLLAQGPDDTVLAHAGLVWWSDVLAAEIHAPRASMLRDRFGASALAWALAQRDLAAGEAAPAVLDDLQIAIPASGRVCLHAWRCTLPQAWRAWLDFEQSPVQDGWRHVERRASHCPQFEAHGQQANMTSGGTPASPARGAQVLYRAAQYARARQAEGAPA